MNKPKRKAAKRPSAPGRKPHRTEPKVDPTRSDAFRNAKAKAESYAKDPERLRRLFEDAAKKSKSIPRGPFKETWAYFQAMLRLIRAYYSGAYRDVPWQSLISIVAAVIYVVNPLDLIPDVIPVIGVLDDALVVAFVLKSVKDDLDAFMEWEAAHGVT